MLRKALGEPTASTRPVSAVGQQSVSRRQVGQVRRARIAAPSAVSMTHPTPPRSTAYASRQPGQPARRRVSSTIDAATTSPSTDSGSSHARYPSPARAATSRMWGEAHERDDGHQHSTAATVTGRVAHPGARRQHDRSICRFTRRL